MKYMIGVMDMFRIAKTPRIVGCLCVIMMLMAINAEVLSQDIQRFNYYSSKEGLSQNTAYSVVCDSRGFIWVGTTNGLNRFDGSTFKVYSNRLDEEYGMVSRRVERIWEDNAGYIWSENYDGTYQYFNQRYETTGLVPRPVNGVSEAATSYLQYSDSLIFVGAESSGLYELVLVDGEYVVNNISRVTAEGAVIRHLAMDSRGDMFVLTSNGLAMATRQQVVSGKLEFYVSNEDIEFTTALCHQKNLVLLGTKGHGLYVYDTSNAKLELYGGLSATTDVVSMTPLADGGFILATGDAKCYMITSDLGSVTPLSYHGEGKDVVEQIYVDQFRQVWIVTANPGVTRVNLVTHRSRYYELVPRSLSATVDRERPYFYEDSRANLWIGLHGGGLLRYERSGDMFVAYRNDINDSNSIPSNIVHCIVEDNSGQLWVGMGQYRGGLAKVVMSNKAFACVLPDQESRQQMDNVVRCLYEDPEHNMWVATKGGRIYIYSANGQLIRTLDGFSTAQGRVQSQTYCVSLHSDGYLMIGTKGAGVFVSRKKVNFANIRNEELVFTQVHTTSDNDDNIYALAEDSRGHVWAATYGEGLCRMKMHFEEGKVDKTYFTTQNSNLLSDKTRYVYIDSNATLWVATTNGVCKMPQERYYAPASYAGDSLFDLYVHSSARPSLSYNDVCNIYEDSRHIIYFATIGGGVTALDTDHNGEEHFTVYNTDNGLSHNDVYGVVEDNGGYLWVSSENGLTRIDLAANTFVVYNMSTGLAFDGFAESAICKQSNGMLAFGGYRGYIAVSPFHIASTPYKSRLVLTSLSVANREQNPGEGEPIRESILFAKRINLAYDQSSLSIAYKALDYSAPENIQYAYKLEGLDKEWNYVGNQTRAVYTNLTPGKYRFMVKSTYRNGEWSDNICSVEVEVAHPWWLTWWAYIIYIAALSALLYLFILFFSRINRYRRELNVEKKVNEIKLQFFTNIAHEIRTPLTLIVSPIDTLLSSELPQPVQNQLMIIKRNSNRILMLVNQLLDFRKVQNKRMNLKVCEVELGKFVSQVGDSFTLLADHKHIEYNTIIQPDMKPVWIDTTEIDTVVYNLLSNAMKFTDAGKRVTLSISQDEQYSYIKVIDEGCGIKNTDPDVLFKRYTILSTNDLSGTGIGLSLAYELVELHKGKLLVESEVGKGSTFTVRLLNGRKHFEDNPMVVFSENVTGKRFAILPDIQMSNDTMEEAGTDENRRSILFVEDNPEILDYLKQSFKGTYEIFTASNGQEALVVARQQIPSIIISDLMMPVMDGQEMIRCLKDDIATSHIPIIALTANTSTDVEIESYKMGIDAFIAKPFNINQIKAVIENILRRREMMAAQLAGIAPKVMVAEEEGSAEQAAEATASEQVNAEETMDDARSNRGEDQDVSINILSKDEEFVREMVKFTEDNYRDDLSIDRFAEHFHMSRTVFYNKVKGLTGQSPLEFVRQIKFKIAEQLLQKGYNVSEVAYEIGYSDVKYFSKQFRQQYGVAPSLIKKEFEEKAKSESDVEEEK